MEVKHKPLSQFVESVKGVFLKKMPFSSKKEINTPALKWIAISFLVVFVAVVLLMPNDIPVQFSEKMESPKSEQSQSDKEKDSQRSMSSSELWASPSSRSYQGGGRAEINHNTPMTIGGAGNAKTQLHAGTKLPLRLMDKVIVSQDAVPVIAELLLNSQTDSGLRLPAGTMFYGEASFVKGSERAQVMFTKLSLPSGQIKDVQARALGKDGQTGIRGRVYSDGVKNTAGHVLTTFVGGLAAGSVQTDIFGRSQGGIANGALTAVSEAAKSKAQQYGESLKAEREWLELQSGTECDAQLFEAMNLQEGTQL